MADTAELDELLRSIDASPSSRLRVLQKLADIQKRFGDSFCVLIFVRTRLEAKETISPSELWEINTHVESVMKYVDKQASLARPRSLGGLIMDLLYVIPMYKRTQQLIRYYAPFVDYTSPDPGY